MTDLEAVMWRLGRRRPVLGATMTLAVGLGRPAERDAVIARIDALTGAVPRLRDRVAPGALVTAAPRWEPDPGFDVTAHLFESPGGDLMAAVGAVMAEPFEAGRPPWRAVFVPGRPGGRDGLVLHLHHSYADGVAGMRLAAGLFDFEADPPAGPASPAPANGPAGGRAGEPAGPVAVLLGDVAAEVTRTARLAGRVLPWAGRTLAAAAVDPHRALDPLARLAAIARDQLAAATGPASPLLGARSAGTHVASLAVDLEPMRAAGGAIGVSINDVYLAALLGGLARYHEAHGCRPASLRLGIPIDARGGGGAGDDEPIGNRLHAAVIRAPLDVADAGARARLVGAAVRAARAGAVPGLVEDLAGVGGRLPGALGLVGRALGGLDVVASNVAGPPVPLWLGGAPVEQMVPFGPRSGAAVNLTLLSYGGCAFVGVNADPAAVGDPDLLLECLRAGFDEALGTAGAA